MDRFLIRMTSVILVMLLLLIVLGGIVTASHSGFGCGPDWPTCHDKLFPVGINATIEWTHRLVATLTGVVIFFYVAMVFRLRTASTLRILAVVSLVLLIGQVLLGELVVLEDLPPWAVAVHDMTALALLDSFVYAFLVARQPSSRPPRTSRSLKYLLWVGVALSGAVVGLGSGLAHLDPGCANGLAACVFELTRASTGFLVLAILHWSAAFLLVISVLAAYVKAARTYPEVRSWVGWALLLLVVQAALGVLLLETGLSDFVLALHEPIGLFAAATVFASAVVATRGPRTLRS